MSKISVVVNSLNEGSKLKRCLESIKDFADEVVVIDMYSTDNTQAIVKKFNAKTFKIKPLPYIEPARKFAVSKTHSDWVLILDPDETITPELAAKLREIADKDSYSAVNIPRLNTIFGKSIKHTNFWPDHQIRFIKKEKVSFSDEIHSYPNVQGKVLNLPAQEKLAIQHYPYKNVREYLEKMKRYSDIEAQNRFDKGEKFSLYHLIKDPTYDFARRYIRHLGFLDGIVGLQLSLLQVYYYVLVQWKMKGLNSHAYENENR